MTESVGYPRLSKSKKHHPRSDIVLWDFSPKNDYARESGEFLSCTALLLSLSSSTIVLDYVRSC